MDDFGVLLTVKCGVSVSSATEVVAVMRLVLRCGGAASVLAVLAAVLAVGPAGAVSGAGWVSGAGGVVVQTPAVLCDASGVSQFGDVAADGYGAAHVLCARALGLTKGRADGSFGPDDALTREQMAAFLVRLWRDVLDRGCPEEVSHGFVDVAASFAEADIECLVGLGITKGTTATTFSPQATLSTPAVTRFVARLLVRSGAASCDLSQDDLARAAACLAALGVAASAQEAAAEVGATRAMMAVYLVGAWHHASGQGRPAVSAPPRLIAGLKRVEWLERNRPALHGRFRALRWVADGIDYSERDAAQLIVDSAIHHPDTFKALLRLPWAGDDDITAAETDAIYGIHWSVFDTPAVAEQMLQLPWLQDDITAAEGTATKYLYRSTRADPALAEQILAKPWLQDDITPDEATATKYLYRLARVDTTLAEQLLTKPWLQDVPITRDEKTVIKHFYDIASTGGTDSARQAVIEAAVTLLDMPFLDTIESPDAMAMVSLAEFVDAGSSGFLKLLTYPTLGDGIDDEEAKLITVLGETNREQPSLVPVLLDGKSVSKEERTINLSHSGEVLLAIIRFSDHSNPNLLDYLEHAVRHHEGFMGEPLPTNYVAWYFVDYVPAGWHAGTHIASNPVRDPAVGEYWRAPRHAAHETGHYYWRGSGQPWLIEGAADILVMLSEAARVGRPLVHNRAQCLEFDTLVELEKLDTYACSWHLGQRIFLDLYHALGEDAFRPRFRSLYLTIRSRDEPGCEAAYVGICHLETAFKTGVSDELAAKVDEIIGHWYYGITATHEADRAELVALYHELGGSRWVDSTHWLSDAHIGEWYGVTTDAGGRVIELDLSENGLSGPLSSRLANLRSLRELLLDHNRLSGQIPDEVGNLTNLTRLELDDNELTGAIPPSLGNLTNLTRLELDDNELTGAIPPSLGNLTNLTRFELGDNELTGAIPPSLGNLTRAARYLRFAGGNRLAGCTPGGLDTVADNDLADLGIPSC